MGDSGEVCAEDGVEEGDEGTDAQSFGFFGSPEAFFDDVF